MFNSDKESAALRYLRFQRFDIISCAETTNQGRLLWEAFDIIEDGVRKAEEIAGSCSISDVDSILFYLIMDTNINSGDVIKVSEEIRKDLLISATEERGF